MNSVEKRARQWRREMLSGTCRTRLTPSSVPGGRREMAKAQFARFLYYYAYCLEQVNNCTSIFVQKKNCTSIYVPVGCYMCLGVGLIPASASGVSYKSRYSSRIISWAPIKMSCKPAPTFSFTVVEVILGSCRIFSFVLEKADAGVL